MPEQGHCLDDWRHLDVKWQTRERLPWGSDLRLPVIPRLVFDCPHSA